MLGGKLTARPGRHADHQRGAELIARHVTYRRRRIEDLVERKQAEIDRHQLNNGAHAGHGRANARAGEAGFRQWRITDTTGAELRQQTLAYGIAAAISADILAHQKNVLIAAQRIADRLTHRVAIAELDGCRYGVHDKSCVRLPSRNK
jgi:hypothetical protein